MRKLSFLLLIIFNFFFIGTGAVFAQMPTPTPIVCDQVAFPEFHSLRPYQGSPCVNAVSETAEFCGNSLTFSVKIRGIYNPASDNCLPLPNGNVRCSFNQNENPYIQIDLKGANLPIMGNTEEVINSQNPIKEGDDSNNMPPEDRVNDYVSWYLNGIFNRAEYSPITKEAIFLNEIACILNGTCPKVPSLVDFSGPLNKLLPQEIQNVSRAETVDNAVKDKRHNQVVGCTYGLKILGKQIGAIPGPCYTETPLSSDSIIEEHRLEEWKNHLPPKRSDYPNYSDYYVAYQKWRGKKCFEVDIPEIIPIIGGKTIVLCGEDFSNPNYYSNLYPYIPLSSTEDRKGEATVSPTVTSTDEVTVSNVVSSVGNSTLYFAHMEEVNDLAAQLQNTYAYKEAKTDEAGNSVPIQTSGACTVLDVRSNKGDSLFATAISGNINFDVKFDCDFDPENPSPQSCEKTVPITLAMTTKTPLAENVWARLVSGPASIFRKMFPKLGTNSNLGEIKDIPASTTVNYSGNVTGIGELIFPHIGSISEYFLKGIQTMLRPKGFGETISFGESTTGSCNPGTVPNLPTATGACLLKTTAGILSIPELPPTLAKIIEAASETFKVPPGLILGLLYGEGKFNPGKYDWTEENVQNWAKGCVAMPGCTPDVFPAQGIVPFQTKSTWNQNKDAVKTIDPAREPNVCNLLDGIFAAAKMLQKFQLGTSNFASVAPDGKCFGITLNTGGGGSPSCSWDQSDIQTAIKVWENGYLTDACYTKTGGCTLGNANARCEGGDYCEKYATCFSSGGCSSHSYCVWSISKHY